MPELYFFEIILQYDMSVIFPRLKETDSRKFHDWLRRESSELFYQFAAFSKIILPTRNVAEE